MLTTSDFKTLEIIASHAVLAGGLAPHLSDPFDRKMIAQAHSENLTLVSLDERFPPYDVELLLLS